MQNRLIQTSQTGGQWYNDTSPFSIPWLTSPKSFMTFGPDRAVDAAETTDPRRNGRVGQERGQEPVPASQRQLKAVSKKWTR